MPKTALKILGLDPSFRNWGVSACEYLDGELTVLNTHIYKTLSKKSSKQKQSHKDIEDAHILYSGLIKSVKWADIICIEIPHGSQKARGSLGNGVCYGVIAALSVLNPNMVYVSANDVKAIVRLNKEHKPTKKEVIEWVRNKHPEAPLPNTLQAEHICDSIVAIHAAMLKPDFKEYIK